MTYIPPLDDFRFLMEEVFDLSTILGSEHYPEADAGLVRAVLEEAARFTRDILGPTNAIADEIGSRFIDDAVRVPGIWQDVYKQYGENGWIGLNLPERFGGQNLPFVVQAPVAEMVTGACMAFSMLPLMGRAAAKLLIAHADAELQHVVVPKLAAGDWAATICITEAVAGSDVGRIRTRAVPLDERTWSLTGSKIFITFGDHDLTKQIVHLVLARTPDAPPGTRGLSLFLVPKWEFDPDGSLKNRNPVAVGSTEHKMGLHASPTCVLNLDKAKGFLVGQVGSGLKAMFEMVHVMRLETGIQGLGVASAATRRALSYAAERLQGGPADAAPVAIIEHADVRRMLCTMLARVEAMRAMMFDVAMQLDLATVLVDPAGRDRAARQADWLLPVCKAFFTATGFEVVNLALQCFGGHGYVKDTGMEQYVRDLRIAAIYEGTNGIQAFDLVVRKHIHANGRYYAEFTERIRADLERAHGRADLAELSAAVADTLGRADRVSAAYLDGGAEQRRDAEGGAAAYLALLGRLASAWMWLRMAAVANGESALHRKKRKLAKFYMSYLLPEVEALEQQAYPGRATTSITQEELLC